MSGVIGFSREAVRIKVKKCEGLQQPEFRKFSVDPQITSFEVLQSILAKAFDIKGDFTICYRLYDVYDNETYMPLLSDWDLDAAFLKAHNISMSSSSDPCLCLQVDLKPFEECSDDWDVAANVPVIMQIRTGNAQEAKPSPRLHGIINQMGKTFNMVQRAFNFGEDGSTSLQPPRPPLSDSEFRKYLDPVGQITHAKELRSAIYYGGIDPSLRKVVWKHILNVYPEGMSGRERMDYIRKKASEYVCLKETWKTAVACGSVVGELAYTTGMVRKDVLRTDRHHRFYAGSDDNQNIASLFNILTTYALNHPKVSYCQGMSDLASPLLVTMGDEAHAYICFCALMSRLCSNFMLDGIAMTQKFTHLAEGLMYYDPEFYNYLKSHQADDLLFCYRWLLLEMKREFAFDDSLRMLEVLWSSLPADPPAEDLKLYDLKFQPPPASTPPISPLVKTPRESAYTKVCAIRRQSSSLSLVSFSAKKVPAVKRQNHSLDESIGRCKGAVLETKTKHQSLDDATLMCQKNDSPPKSPRNLDASAKSKRSGELRPRSVSPLEPKSDSVILNNRINTHKSITKSKSASLSSSMTNLIKHSKKSGHFKDLKERIAAGRMGIFSSLDHLDSTRSIKEENESKPTGKVVKNLNEFLNFTSTNKRKMSNRLMRLGSSSSSGGERPKITLTRSSLDDSESSSGPERLRHFSSTSNSCDDTFDECSPDDSQEYFPMTTSMTRELRLELENLDRQVFGKLLESDSSCSECSGKTKNKCDCVVSKTNSEVLNTDTRTEVAEIDSTPKFDLNCGTSNKKDVDKRDDIFIWENPLHQTSPNLTHTKNIQTPDEQAELDYDIDSAHIVNETSKLVTPITILHSTKATINSTDLPGGEVIMANTKRATTEDFPNCKNEVDVNGVHMTNSCEEVTEAIKSANMLPPPNEFGGGNPFLMFLCVTVLLQHRDHIMSTGMDYNEVAMHFDKMVRKHHVTRVLNQARQMYAGYIKRHTLSQHKHGPRDGAC